ncbi:hypothetical protein DHD80_18175 [Gramella sp. AN32]|nr:hypothetical protein [Gramella sp. AN32]
MCISTDTITIFNKGKSDNHFQQWKVNNYEINHDTYKTYYTYNTHLILNGEGHTSAAIFRVNENIFLVTFYNTKALKNYIFIGNSKVIFSRLSRKIRTNIYIWVDIIRCAKL